METPTQPSYLQALESSSLSYQESLVSAERQIGNSFVESRKYQMDLFYSRSHEISLQLDPPTQGQFDSAIRSVARTFEIDISLEVSFLSQFVQQSSAISEMDAELFERYLQDTEGFAAASSGELKSLFEEVG